MKSYRAKHETIWEVDEVTGNHDPIPVVATPLDEITNSTGMDFSATIEALPFPFPTEKGRKFKVTVTVEEVE